MTSLLRGLNELVTLLMVLHTSSALIAVEAAVCFSPAGAEEARVYSVDFLFHFDTEELGIEMICCLKTSCCRHGENEIRRGNRGHQWHQWAG